MITTDTGTRTSGRGLKPLRFLFGAIAVILSGCLGPAEPRLAARVVVTPGAVTLVAVQDTSRLIAVAADAKGNPINGKRFTWASSDYSVATVDSIGLVIAVGNGTARITATADQTSDTATVVVDQKIVSIAVAQLNVTAWAGATFQLTATARDANSYPVPSSKVNWTSSDSAIATVSPVGVVTARRAGSTTISVVAQDRTASARVDVQATLSGVLAISSTLTKSAGPYHVTGNILVPFGLLLRVEPGTTILFDGPYYVRVDGMLVAIGLPTDSIRFTSAKSSPQAGDWSRIWFTNTSTSASVNGAGGYVDGSAISYAVISYGGEIQFDASSPYFSNNHLHHVTGAPPRDWPNGAIWTCNSTSVIRDNVIEDNPVSGIYIGGGAVKISGNVIRRNTGAWGGGLFFANPNCAGSSFGTPIVEYNRISANRSSFGGGIALYSGAPIIRYNDITANETTGTLSPGSNAQSGGAALATFTATAMQLSYNNIENNVSSATGATCALFFGDSFTGTMTENNIGNPVTYEVYVNTTAKGSISLPTNYWNTTAATAVEAKIWDFTDDFSLAKVLYTPIRSARQTSAGPP